MASHKDLAGGRQVRDERGREKCQLYLGLDAHIQAFGLSGILPHSIHGGLGGRYQLGIYAGVFKVLGKSILIAGGEGKCLLPERPMKQKFIALLKWKNV